MRSFGRIKVVVLLPANNRFQGQHKKQASHWLERHWYSTDLTWWHMLTWPAMQLFKVGSRLKKQRDLAQAQAPEVPVIIVGNIHVGGTGKSPVVQALALAAAAQGLQVGVLLRGYGGSGPYPQLVTPDTSVDMAGDEALMHAHCFAQATLASTFEKRPLVVVDPKRTRGAAFLADQSVDLIICDDGLQHYQLQRDYEILIFDPVQGAGRGYLLPSGPLREPLQRLQSVDLILSVNGFPPEFNAAWPDTQPYQASYTTSPGAIQPLMPAGRSGFISQQELPEGTWTAIAGIARPERFFQSLQQQGLTLDKHVFADHYRFTVADLARLGRLQQPIVMTSKDSVKIKQLLNTLPNTLSISDQQDRAALEYFYHNAYVTPYTASLKPALVDRILQGAKAACDQRLTPLKIK